MIYFTIIIIIYKLRSFFILICNFSFCFYMYWYASNPVPTDMKPPWKIVIIVISRAKYLFLNQIVSRFILFLFLHTDLPYLHAQRIKAESAEGKQT